MEFSLFSFVCLTLLTLYSTNVSSRNILIEIKTPQKHDQENYSEPEHVIERSNQEYQNQPDYGRTDYGRTDYGRTDFGSYERTDFGRTDYGRTDYGRTDYGRTDYGTEPGRRRRPGRGRGVSPSTSTSSSSRGNMSDEEFVNPKNPKNSNIIM